jgi:hypothetical protein
MPSCDQSGRAHEWLAAMDEHGHREGKPEVVDVDPHFLAHMPVPRIAARLVFPKSRSLDRVGAISGFNAVVGYGPLLAGPYDRVQPFSEDVDIVCLRWDRRLPLDVADDGAIQVVDWCLGGDRDRLCRERGEAIAVPLDLDARDAFKPPCAAAPLRCC